MTTPGPTPLEVFETIRARATTMLQTVFMEASWPWDEQLYEKMLKPVLGVGIAAASEHYAEHPEHIVLAGQPICTECREPIQTLQAGVDVGADPESTALVRVAWPCGHQQS